MQELDRANLIEEIEDLGRSARQELRSSLEGLVLHLLKWHCQADYRSRSWRDSIEGNRACVPESLQHLQDGDFTTAIADFMALAALVGHATRAWGYCFLAGTASAYGAQPPEAWDGVIEMADK